MFVLKKEFLKQQRNCILENLPCCLWMKKLPTTNVLMLTPDGPYCPIDRLAMGSQPAPSNIWLLKFEPNIRDDAKPFER